MHHLLKKLSALSVVLLLGLSLAACGESEHENQHENHHDEISVEGMEIMTRGADPERLAYTHGDHWHGSLPFLEVDGSHLSIGVNWVDSDDEAVEIDYDHYSFDARFADGADEIIELVSHGDHVHLRPGDTAGTTAVIFQLLHHSEVVYESPEIDVTISESDENGMPEVVDMAVLDRDDERQVTADTHGNHWHGSLPTLEVDGNRSSLGVVWLDADEDPIEIDYADGYEYNARFATGADEDLIEIVTHGDHIHLRPGDTAGTTSIHFQLLHGSDVVYESPAIDVVVEEAGD